MAAHRYSTFTWAYPMPFSNNISDSWQQRATSWDYNLGAVPRLQQSTGNIQIRLELQPDFFVEKVVIVATVF